MIPDLQPGRSNVESLVGVNKNNNHHNNLAYISPIGQKSLQEVH